MNSFESARAELSETRRWNDAFQCFELYPEKFAATYHLTLLKACQGPAPSCSLVQFLSRCLKLGRIHSHPERNIGRTVAAHTSEDPRHRQDDSIIEYSLTLLPNALHRIKSAPAHYAYFALVFLKDMLKENSPHCSAVHIARSLCIFSGHISYKPALSKLTELCMALIDEKKLELNTIQESLHLLTAVLDTFAAILDKTNFQSSESRDICKFLAKEGLTGCSTVVMLFSSVIRILNRVLAIRLYPDLNQEADIRLVESICSQANVMLRAIINICAINDILTMLSEDDPSLMQVLLGMLEIQLRLSVVVSEPVDKKKNMYSSLLHCFRELGLGPINSFLWFINDGLCMDTSVLVDLVSSSETVALKYVLRIVKYLKSNIVNLKESTDGIEMMELFLTNFSTTLRKLHNRNVLPFKAGPLCLSIDSLLSVIVEDDGLR